MRTQSHSDIQHLYNQVCDDLFSKLSESENLSVSLSGEESLFLRFNQNHVRQSTTVEQNIVQLKLQSEQKETSLSVLMTMNPEENKIIFAQALNRMRLEIPALDTNPFFVELKNHGQSKECFERALPEAQEVIAALSQSSSGLDLAGLYSAGPIYRASRNNLGQNHWYSSDQFFLDYSLYTKNSEGDNKAVKSLYSSTKWSASDLKDSLLDASLQLQILKRPNKTVSPGKYRVYLAPGAASELVGMLGWNALSYSAYKKGNCALGKLLEKKKRLSPLFSVKENFDLGLCPKFNNEGELSPNQIPLIEKGELISMLVSSRAAKEYGVEANGADNSGFMGMEVPRSPDFSTGSLLESQALKELGTGLYLNNLHYLNWSEVSNARITGMTRYACFWVENGEIVAPIQDLRFDETLYHALGDGLMAVTSKAHIEPDTSTYVQRVPGGRQVPGMLIDYFTFTL